MRQSFLHNGAPKYNGELSSLSGWFTTPQGAYVLGWELAQFDSAVDDVFGFRAVQLGLPEVDFLRQNRIAFRFSLALEPGAAVAADPLQLPLAAQSVDLLALPHVLEFHHNPHEVLREAEHSQPVPQPEKPDVARIPRRVLARGEELPRPPEREGVEARDHHLALRHQHALGFA